MMPSLPPQVASTPSEGSHSTRSSRRHFPIRIHITTAFALLLLLVGGALGWLAYQRTARILENSTSELTRHAANEAALELDRILAPAQTGVLMLAVDGSLSSADLEVQLRALPSYIEALKAAPAVAAIFWGDQAGNYFLARRLLDEDDRQLFKAPASTRYLVQSIDRRPAPPVALYIYYDASLRELGRSDSLQSLDFDPRQRPWFKLARERDGIVMTPPYTFFTSQKRGLTIASRGRDHQKIFGADVRLDTLSALLQRQRMTPGSHLALRDGQGQLLASDSALEAGPDGVSQDPIFAKLNEDNPRTVTAAELRRVDLADETWYLAMPRLPLADDQDTYLGVAVPEAEMLSEAHRVRDHLLLLVVALLLLSFPVAIWLARRIAQPLTTLVRETETIRSFDLASPIQVESFIFEVDELASTLRLAKTTLARFLDIITRLTNEPDFNRLMPELLRATTETAQADGGLLFLVSTGQDPPRPTAGLWDSRPLSWDDLASEGDAFSCRAALAQGQPLAFKAKASDRAHFGLPPVDAVSVPLFNRARDPIGVLVLLSRQGLDPARIRFMEALSGFAAVALETRELIATQKALFESFIKMMAAAIDAKSPYTGSHCARVPEVVKLLAEAVCRQSAGPYADFSMNPDQWEALHIAAWLHDCGKVTTPEYVVDKATKLETLYDRIHEVRMRFEVLKRDAEIDYLRALAASADPASARAERDAAWEQLDDDFAFVAACNQGSEFMAPEDMARLRGIAKRTWLRTLSDRLGISAEESRRRAAAPEVPLPILEPLLSDRPEHRHARPESERFGPDNPWGFAMPVPALLYDRGELKNLMIARGTLAEEERYKINEHIIQTIIMLTALPFPRHLAEVPEIASGHHERMDGKGYPRGLTGDHMSPLARMMAIADIFEALTANDRPYKPAKSLSQSLGIMKQMVEAGHIDRELFRIFLGSGACLRYAERFLAPAQQDTTEFDAFMPQP
ncbi:MAG: HD domain-containing phosphohydrolase [Chromatiaceae bacterium]